MTAKPQYRNRADQLEHVAKERLDTKRNEAVAPVSFPDQGAILSGGLKILVGFTTIDRK